MVRKFPFLSSPRLRFSPRSPTRRLHGDDVKLKTAEDYHVALHEKLLDVRKDTTDFINLYLLSCYGIVGLIVLYMGGYISKFSFSGADIDLNKGYILEYAAGLVIIAYMLISFHVLRLARIFRSIRLNKSELKGINPNARVIGVEDMHLYVGGLLGLMLAFARAQTRMIMDNLQSLAISLEQSFNSTASFRQRPSLKSAIGMTHGTVVLVSRSLYVAPRLLLRTTLAAIIIYLPLVFPIIAIAVAKYGDKVAGQPDDLMSAAEYYIDQIKPIDSILLIVFFYVIATTIVSSIALSSGYSRELIMKFAETLNLSISQLAAKASREEDLKQLTLEIDKWWQGIT